MRQIVFVTVFTAAVIAALACTTHPDATYTRDEYCYDVLRGTPRPDGCHLPGGIVITPTPPQDDR